MREQLAIEVTEVKAFGDEGSGGSTPLLMTTDDGTRIFGKILATSHARSDRWYRIMRTILYGQLEDETPFGTVRRLIGYEDYALRLLDDDGVRIAKSYGIVELTPNREYLLPTEFFEGSQTLGHAEVNDEIIDQSMALIRTLWDQGLAHRDIKPANLLVVDGRLQLIDVSGLEVRPSAWRQAVDLANMMLVMALRTDTQRVYDAALRYFTPRGGRRGVRVRGGARHPDRASAASEGGPPRPHRGVQGVGADLSEGLDPALERAADRSDGRSDRRGDRGDRLLGRRDPLRHRLTFLLDR